MDKIIIKGARENNLKNINLELPKNKLIVKDSPFKKAETFATAKATTNSHTIANITNINTSLASALNLNLILSPYLYCVII